MVGSFLPVEFSGRVRYPGSIVPSAALIFTGIIGDNGVVSAGFALPTRSSLLVFRSRMRYSVGRVSARDITSRRLPSREESTTSLSESGRIRSMAP